MKDKGLTYSKRKWHLVYILSKNKQFRCFVRAVRVGCNFPRCCTDARRFEGKQDNFCRLEKQENFWSVFQQPWFFDNFVINLKYAIEIKSPGEAIYCFSVKVLPTIFHYFANIDL